MSDYTLYLGDCLDYMRTMEPGSVDAVITDPPYGINENNNKNLSRSNIAKSIDYGDFDWDKKPATKEQIDYCRKCSQSQVIFGGNYFHLPPSSGWVVWDKLNGKNDFSDCELAWTSYKRGVRIFRYLWNGMIKDKPEIRYHPTQKPLALMLWIIENYTSLGDLIFDPFMGSGTTGVAALQLGRRFIGCEIDPGYFAIAEKRIKQAAAQMLLPLEIGA